MGKNDIPSHTINGQVQQSYYETPDSPLRAALQCITGQEPPEYVKGYSWDDIPEEHWHSLQEWAASAVANVGHEWMTGIGTIEAAIHMVSCAEENGNIGTNPRFRGEQKQPIPGPDARELIAKSDLAELLDEIEQIPWSGKLWMASARAKTILTCIRSKFGLEINNGE